MNRTLALARLYRTLREVGPSIEPWEVAGLQYVLDKLSRLTGADAARIGLGDEPWAAVGVTRGLR